MAAQFRVTAVLPPRARVVDGPGHQLLAGTAFPTNQDRGRRGRHARDL